MIRIYRVLRKPYARTPFDGEGAYRYGGRWSSPGIRLSYTSEHQSLAMLEYFVHVEQQDPPTDLMLAVAEIPDDLAREKVDIADLPANWREPAAPAELTRIGDEFARRAENCLLLLPSVLVPRENNYLLNPAHPDHRKIIIREPEPLSYDPRMFQRHRGRGKT